MTPLRRRMQEELQRRNYSDITAVCYLRHVAEFAKHFGRSPDLLGAEEIKQFQLHLIQNRKVSWATYIQAMAALRFLYVKTLGLTFMAGRIPYPKRPKLLPTVLSQEEVSRLLDGTRSLKHRALLMTLYGGGLRVSEACRLTLADIDSSRMVIRIQQAKGRKDRNGLSPDHTEWISARRRFLLPVKVLSRVFRGKFLALLQTAFRKGRLLFHGGLAALQPKPAFQTLLRRAYDTEWVVYTKPPFGGPEQVLRYLSRYTHRVAISNHRIVKIADGNVTFLWRDYAHGNKKKKMTLPACEFLRRFFLHVLPQGFVRIRHFGFLANRHRSTLLELCRRLLQVRPTVAAGAIANLDLPQCPACRAGRLRIIEHIPSQLRALAQPDSSRSPPESDSKHIVRYGSVQCRLI